MKFVKNIILEDIEPVTFESSHLDEIATLNDKALKDVDKEITISKDVMNSFNVKPELNPEIWLDEKLFPEIKQVLIRIAKDFFKKLNLPQEMKLKDVLLVGSLANYNWSKFSDIDLHLVTDFSAFEDQEVLKTYFDNAKNLWNQTHGIDIKGYPVEIYVQDVPEKLHASAIYSIPNEKWILKPDKKKITIDKTTIKRKVQMFIDKLRDIKNNYDSKEFQDVVDKSEKLRDNIKKMRSAGLEKGGEYSLENLIFKVLRRTDYIEVLDSYKVKAYDQLVSVNETI